MASDVRIAIEMTKKISQIDFAYSLFVDQYNKYGDDDVAAVLDVLKTGRLFYPIGNVVSTLERRLAQEFCSPGCCLVSSGTAAVHTALAAAGVTFGDEVVTTPLADTGTVIPILLQNAVPVFADVDPRTLMITAESIERVVTSKTAAVLLVHLGGFAADIDPIVALCKERGIRLIEDCAQAPLTQYRGGRVGTFGTSAAFSTNDTKHVSCGDGGFVVGNSVEAATTAKLFHDKGFDRSLGVRNPSIVAPNYRMTELQAAVLNVQWSKLQHRVRQRAMFAQGLDSVVDEFPFLSRYEKVSESESSYFSSFFFVDVDSKITRNQICEELCAVGIPARRGNLYEVLYSLNIFSNAFPKHLRPMVWQTFSPLLCPFAEQSNQRVVRMEMLEIFGVDELGRFRDVLRRLSSLN